MSYSYNEVKREQPSMISIALRLNSMRTRAPGHPAPLPETTPEQISEYKERLRTALESRNTSREKSNES